jgi:hypothetical protein
MVVKQEEEECQRLRNLSANPRVKALTLRTLAIKTKEATAEKEYARKEASCHG